MSMWWPLLCLACMRHTDGKIYFKETFDELWESRWVVSKKHEHEDAQGDFNLGTGKWFADPIEDQGLETAIDEDHRYFGISATFPSFSNEDKDLIIQFQVKWERDVECGGSYIKIGPTIDDQEQFGKDTPWHLMFGPDKCGPSNKKTHLIFHIDGQEVPKTEPLPYEQQAKGTEPHKYGVSHLYRLALNHDNVVRVDIDGKKVYQGNMRDGWNILAQPFIPDPDAIKADWWVDEEMLDDLSDKKPADWVDEARLPDPEAIMPDDWDPEEDGEWEPQTWPNPEFKGKWMPRQYQNPQFGGKWTPLAIRNPEYKNNKKLYRFKDIGYVGFDLWQVKGGTIFDNIIITDNKKTADKFMEKWRQISAVEEREYAEWYNQHLDNEHYKKIRRQDKNFKDYDRLDAIEDL